MHLLPMQLAQQRANKSQRLHIDGHACTEAAPSVVSCGKKGASKFKAMKVLSIISKLYFRQLK